MKKVLWIATGGTIASVPGENGYHPDRNLEGLFRMIDRARLPQIDVETPFCCDSSDIQPEHWVILAKTVEQNNSRYDGFVITHGTDTMAYTAAALSFMLKGIQKPVILTGSQKTADQPQSDAPQNLQDAFSAACHPEARGVRVVFAGRILDGACVRKTDSLLLDAFHSVNCPQVGFFRDGVPVIEHPAPVRKPDFRIGVDPAVALFRLTPGFLPELLLGVLNLPVRAVVLECFGLGGFPTARNSLLPALKKLRDAGIFTVAVTQCPSGPTDLSVYEVGKKAEECGVTGAGNMTTEAVVAKLMCLLFQERDGKIVKRRFFEE